MTAPTLEPLVISSHFCQSMTLSTGQPEASQKLQEFVPDDHNIFEHKTRPKKKSFDYLRSRYFKAIVKRKLNSKIYPIVAPTPIQYQLACGKIPRDFKTETPRNSVELGANCNTKTTKVGNFSSLVVSLNRLENLVFLHVSTCGQETHSQLVRFVHTSLERSSSPKSTRDAHHLNTGKFSKSVLFLM